MNFIKSLTPEKVSTQLDRYFQKVQSRQPDMPLQVRVYSQQQGIDYTFPRGSSIQPYHTASVGKVFTAVLVQMLAERGCFTIDDAIHPFFSSGGLDNLFVYQKVDHQKNVTIRQLLAHTSGIADYVEGKTSDGETLLSDALNHPDHHWTPQALIDFTREYQKAVAEPGKRFNYSDTGYILLGLLVEKVTGKSFGQNLEDEFFRPLEMTDSYLMFYTKPADGILKPIEQVWLDGHEISRYESLSLDWAGGGVVSTTDDLLKFNRALREGRLIKLSTLCEMDICPNKFRAGIYYGLGMMEIRFHEFFFLLGRLPKIKGHIGILATHMFHDAVKDAHIILNFGSAARMHTSFMALIEIENLLHRMG